MKESNTDYEIFTGVDTTKKAYEEAKRVLEQHRDVKAFFVSGDERALGAYRAIYEKGLSIPEDIAVLGIDNITLGEYFYPPISTIEQDFELLAKQCIDYVISKIEDPETERRSLRFPGKVIERRST